MFAPSSMVQSRVDRTFTAIMHGAEARLAELLRESGYQFMGSQIKVPHSLKTTDDVAWLRANIAPEYWEEARRSARRPAARPPTTSTW